ncbi:MAG: hypothetical protein ACD_9C00199G0004 [uncultured bacterium]|nr:MAG: hypothetical protein ACD_9C00199G0004 [uncultured bacterium]
MAIFWSVILASIVNMVIGYYWYSEKFFGKKWRQYAELSDEKLSQLEKKDVRRSYVINFIASFIMVYMLAFFLLATEAVTVFQALGTAFWLWLGFIATTHIGSVLFEKKSKGYFFINTLYYLIVLFVDSFILIGNI